MAKITLTTLGSRYGSIDALNANFDAIEAAFENTLSRDGSTPNNLEANLDADSNRIINLADGVNNQDAATVKQVNNIISAASTGIIAQLKERKTATLNQTVFTLSSITYTPGSNNLAVYIDGVRQYVGESYIETSSTVVTFTAPLHLGAEVLFLTNQSVDTSNLNASAVKYDPAGTGAVQTTVQAKLRETVSVKDFGAVGDGVTDDTVAIQAALNTKTSKVYLPSGTYVTSNTIKVYPDQMLVGDGNNMSIIQSAVSGSAGYENYVPCVATVDANGSYALDAKDLQNHTHFRDFRIVNTGAYSIGLLYAGAFRGGVRNVSIEGDSGVSAGSRTSLGLVITGLNKASNRGCYYSYFESVYARYQKIGLIYGNRCHSHGPLTDIQVQFCDIGLRQDDGSDFNFNAGYLIQPVTMVLTQADIEVIDGNAIDNLIANNTTIIGTYIDTIGGNGIETQSGNTTILNTYYTSITGSNVNRVGGNIDGINTGFDVGLTIPRVTDGNDALQVGPILNDSDVKVNTPNQRLISGSVDITGTGSSSVASATVTFASLGLPTNVYMAGVWVQVIGSTTGGSSNSLYNAAVSGPILFGADTAFDIHVRNVTGSNISGSETVTVRWFAIAYTV